MSKTYPPKFPLIAKLGDITNCLDRMGESPLKLVAGKVCKKFNESEWNISEWSFKTMNGLIEDKKLLSNPDDTFQFSLANEHSKQEFHAHKNIFEIYVSYSKMEISYIKDGLEENMQIPNGVIIVPPGVAHKMKFYGITFVFQASTKGSKIHEDKVLLKTAQL